MSSLGNRTAILTLSRLANYGLMLISPVLLVRLLTVEAFGQYREFLLYASILQSFAVFSINDSLLYCVPASPSSPWRVARQTVVLTFGSSAIVVLALAVIDLIAGGSVTHGLLIPLSVYTLFSVNLDFWEYFWLANRRPGAVFVYSASRLIIRVTVAVVTAALTHDVHLIIWALVVFEGLRLLVAGIAFFILDRGAAEPALAEPWRDQLRFCVPSGLASVLAMLNRNLSNLVVARALGPIGLARYAIGRFGEPVVVTLRNSVSSVVLPEMVRQERQSREAPLALWQRATVVNAIFLFPLVVLVARYAEPLVVAVFGPDYRDAAIVMQLYMLVVVRECFDFAPALRAINRTRPLIESNVAAIVTCGLALLFLIPLAGLAGAMLAFVLGSLVDVSWLCRRTMQLYDVGFRRIIPWESIGKCACAAAVAGAVIATPAWTEIFGFGGIVLGGVAYLAAFAALLLVLRVPEALALCHWARKLVFRRPSRA